VGTFFFGGGQEPPSFSTTFPQSRAAVGFSLCRIRLSHSGQASEDGKGCYC